MTRTSDTSKLGSRANDHGAFELTADDLEHVSGGKPSAAKGGNATSEYLVVTLKDVIIT